MLVWGFAPDGKRWERSFDFTREEYHTNGGIMKCEYCHREYIQRRYDQRFCCIGCKTEWWVEERRNAIAAYRERGSFFRPSIQPADDESDEGNQVRKVG
jgi:hypothetical protein